MTDPHAELTPPNPPADAPQSPRRIWPWLLLVVLIVGGYLGYSRWAAASAASAATTAKANAARSAVVPVLTAQVQRHDVKVYLSGLLGTVTALYTVTVHTRVDGELVTVAFKEGQFVHQGDMLAEIDPRPYEVQLQQAKGQLAKDQANLANAKVDLERYKVLFSQDSVAKQQLDTQVSTVAQDEAVIEADQAQVNSAQLNLTYCRITAPLTGRIGLRLVDPGNIVHATDTNGMVVITQVQPIAVVFPIPEESLPQVLPQVRAGQAVSVEAYDRGDNPATRKLLATGQILTLDNQVDLTTDTVKVKAVFPNENEALFPNQFVNPSVLVNTLKNVLVLPSAAVQRGPSTSGTGSQATYVFVVKPDHSVEMRTVDVQLTQGDDTVVRSGVTVGETVVTDGLDKLQQGTIVQPRPPAPSSPASVQSGPPAAAPHSAPGK